MQHLINRMKQELTLLLETSGALDKRPFDVKVFNPYAKSNQKLCLASFVSHHEKAKRAYEQRILCIHGTQIKTAFLDFLHPLIWLSVNHVLLSNLPTFSTLCNYVLYNISPCTKSVPYFLTVLYCSIEWCVTCVLYGVVEINKKV